ncbi:MAG: diguanylate cyclase [Clostridiaceae bacterium]|nr:diguanylate cyclase [Clostridiaceae bacterium]
MNVYYFGETFELQPDSVIKLSKGSIGPAIGAIVVAIILIYTIISYFYNRNVSTFLSLITLQFSFFLLLSGYALYSTSTTVAKVDFWTRISYTGLSISPLFGISFIEGVLNKSFKKTKYVTILNCLVCILLVWFEDNWIITRYAKITPHPTMIKGMGFNLLVLYIMGYLFTCYVIFMRHYIKNPECRSLYWPLAVGFTGWSASGLYGALNATSIIRLVDFPWVGPVIMMLASALYQGKLLFNRSKELENAIKEKDALYEQIIHDDLTGVLNRNYLMHTLGQYINHPSFDSVEHCLLFIDLDNFSMINELYGHQGGDALLKLVGRILKETCRKSDIPSRFGGDEFLLYLYDCNEEQAVKIARRIQERYAEEFYKIIDKSSNVSAGLCIGISSSRFWSKTISEIIDQPDFAMFEAKRAGKNRIGVFTGRKDSANETDQTVNLV